MLAVHRLYFGCHFVSFAAFSKFAKFLKRMMALKGTKRPFKFDRLVACKASTASIRFEELSGPLRHKRQ